MKIIKITFLIIFLFFAFIGAMQTSTLLHEYSHYRDYKDLETYEDGKICLFEFPANETKLSTLWNIKGKHSFTLKQRDFNEADRIDNYTEWKAYGISAFVLILFLMSFNYWLWSLK